MAETTTVHPGSWLGDGVEEFKKAPPLAKGLIIAAFVAAIGIGWYEYQKAQGNSSSSIGSSSPSTDTTGSGTNPFPTVPGGNTGQVPVLPGGLQPLFDAAGNLIGFEPGATSTSTTSTGTTSSTSTSTKKPKKTKTTKTKDTGKKSTTATHDKGGDTSGSSHTVKSKSHNVGTKVQTSTGKANPPHPTARKVTVSPNPTAGGAHGYVYTAKGGESLQSLQNMAWPGSTKSTTYHGANNTPGKPTSSTNIKTYANNAQLIKSQHIGSTLKKGQKIIL